MVDYQKRAMTEEDIYSFRQNNQIASQCGFIGYLRGDFGPAGADFFSEWFDYRKDLKTPEFKQEFDAIINDLREEGDILHDKKSLAKYFNTTPQAHMKELAFDKSSVCCGVRVDTEKYTYLFRLNPSSGDYNVAVHCYVKEWLDQHMRLARGGVRFINTNYEELYRVPDGDQIRIDHEDYAANTVVRYVDSYHAEISGVIYHIAEFADMCKRKHWKVIPLRSSLPDYCYSYIVTENVIGIIKKGESGFFKTDISFADKSEAKKIVEEYNKKLCVTKAQYQAMQAGSMFGWEVPAADPAMYDANGTAKVSFKGGNVQ